MLGFVAVGIVVGLALYVVRAVRKRMSALAAAVLGGVGGFLAGGTTALLGGSSDFSVSGAIVTGAGAIALVAVTVWSRSSRRRMTRG